MTILKLWSYLILYLGVGTILGCAVTLIKGFNTGMAVGGILAVIGIGLFAFHTWRTMRKQKAKDSNCPEKRYSVKV